MTSSLVKDGDDDDICDDGDDDDDDDESYDAGDKSEEECGDIDDDEKDYDTQHENLDDDINSGDENWAQKMAMILITLAEIKKPDDYQGNSQDYVTPTARW